MHIAIYVAIVIATYLITAALTPKAKPQPPTAFEDIDFPQVDEGTPQAVIFGDCWSGDWVVLAVGNYRTEAVRSSGGGKK